MKRIVWGEAILWVSFALSVGAYCIEFERELIPVMGVLLIAAIAVRSTRHPSAPVDDNVASKVNLWERYGLPLCGLVALGLAVWHLDRRITSAEDAADNVGYAVDDVRRQVDDLQRDVNRWP